MQKKYNPKKIEKKWQKKWDESGIYNAEDFSDKPKYYCLIEFPYPSGAGLHAGHLRSHIAIDIVARKKRMSGYNVMYPIGWDAFGLPTENFAIKTKTHPAIVTRNNVKNFTRQIKSYGPSFDWSREINTTDPEYYKWTQWIFLKLFNSFYDEKLDKAMPIEKLEIPKNLNELEKRKYIDERRLAYEAEMSINWCPSCKIGLANEEVVNGECERCHAKAEKKTMKQWMLRITKYADRLIRDLDTVDYLDKIKTQQVNWIGKSEGAEIEFRIKNYELRIKTFTTRLDTLFGCTYMVLSPEHILIEKLKYKITNYEEVEKYIEQAKNKSDLDRTDLAKEKTGVELKGIKAINPASGEEIPIWVADYVLASYGTGAIMAVPAHDSRDNDFAVKYGLSIKEIIAPNNVEQNQKSKIKNQNDNAKIKNEIDKNAFTEDGILINSGKYTGLTSAEAREKMTAWLEKENLGKKAVNYKLRDWVFSRQHYWGEPIPIVKCKHCGLKDLKIKNELSFYDQNIWKQIVENKKTIETRALNPKERERYFGDIKIGDFVKFNNKNTNEFEVVKISKVYNFRNLKELFESKYLIEKIIPGAKITKLSQLEKAFSFTEDYIGRIEKNGLVGWEFEIINTTKNIPLSEKDLPLELPNVKNYEPTDTGESPLANITKWVNVKCPICKSDAKRETDTMPNWAGSSWYYLAYLMQGISNFQFPISNYKKAFDYWMPVDLYNGGMEHTTLHLLYSRFWHKLLFDLGYVNTAEPYAKRRSHGMILAEDGQKMSKSRGNVVNPDDVIEKYGADTVRLYEMFMGPYGDAIPWSTTSLVGMNRFLDRVWNLKSRIKNEELRIKNEKLESLLHKTIKKVTEDIENLKFNTAISALMILLNEMSACGGSAEGGEKTNLSIIQYSKFLILLSPFTPHITEEIWEALGNKESIHLQKWPEYNPELAKEKEINLVIQINGKLRDQIKTSADISEADAKKLALESEKIKKWIAGKEVRKVIFVKGRLVNIVV
jgi:leucyl-tRNA synthetase